MEGNPNRKIKVMTELIMQKAEEHIEDRKEPRLTTGQYNSVFEAIQEILDGNV